TGSGSATTEDSEYSTLLHVEMDPEKYGDLVEVVKANNSGFILGVGANPHEVFEAVVIIAPLTRRDQVEPLLRLLYDFGAVDMTGMHMEDVEEVIQEGLVEDLRV